MRPRVEVDANRFVLQGGASELDGESRQLAIFGDLRDIGGHGGERNGNHVPSQRHGRRVLRAPAEERICGHHGRGTAADAFESNQTVAVAREDLLTLL